ncbi:MAG: sulfurtransferase [Candidatus Sumerlaeia bacterium]|nr:sulfurtransferase [Candidatus Sumerlaeia bacterium]
MKNHSPEFLAIVEDAKKRVREVTVKETLEALGKDSNAVLVDVREESEYAAGHVKGAEHLGKGVLERDIENLHPDKNQPLYLYCGGGFRSALAADNAIKMGYKNAVSVAGGWRAFLDEGVETEKG